MEVLVNRAWGFFSAPRLPPRATRIIGVGGRAPQHGAKGGAEGDEDQRQRGRGADDGGEGASRAELEQLGVQQCVHDRAPVSVRKASSSERTRGASPNTATRSWPAISPTCAGVAPWTCRTSPSRSTRWPRRSRAPVNRTGSCART